MNVRPDVSATQSLQANLRVLWRAFRSTHGDGHRRSGRRRSSPRTLMRERGQPESRAWVQEKRERAADDGCGQETSGGARGLPDGKAPNGVWRVESGATRSSVATRAREGSGTGTPGIAT